MCVNCKVFD